MGVTIHYRGTLDNVERIPEMEDRVMDLVFSLGGKATVWRSFADHDTSRVVRGLMIEMTPGQETMSLLVSPEGHLTPLFQIEEAEQSAFPEAPYCSIKTQFGSLVGHVPSSIYWTRLKNVTPATVPWMTAQTAHSPSRN